VRTAKPEAAAAARIGAALARRKRAELLDLPRPCFARTGPWLQAGKYAATVMSQIPRRNGWTIAAQAGDRAPDRTQRLLSRAVWDTVAAMAVVRRFAVAGLDEAACRTGRRRGLAVGAVNETGQVDLCTMRSRDDAACWAVALILVVATWPGMVTALTSAAQGDLRALVGAETYRRSNAPCLGRSGACVAIGVGLHAR
jgi:hypothetical protein